MSENHVKVLQNKPNKSWKWIILSSFALNSYICLNNKNRMSNIFIYSGLSPIWSSVALYYGVTDYDLNWYPNMYFLALMFASFIFNPFILKFYGAS